MSGGGCLLWSQIAGLRPSPILPIPGRVSSRQRALHAWDVALSGVSKRRASGALVHVDTEGVGGGSRIDFLRAAQEQGARMWHRQRMGGPLALQQGWAGCKYVGLGGPKAAGKPQRTQRAWWSAAGTFVLERLPAPSPCPPRTGAVHNRRRGR